MILKRSHRPFSPQRSEVEKGRPTEGYRYRYICRERDCGYCEIGRDKDDANGRRTGPKPGGKENERWETSDRLRFHFLFTWPEKCGEAPRIIGWSSD